ncbi:hypothetical protein PT974_07737 [Cladobotryum mycophilum]|uniref:CENP-V/GFA domain-containing protein n=1 Tax=Cladobotryum mycophilum TaxID=491253 RepID=A0ABR0SHQ9_9HYPO
MPSGSCWCGQIKYEFKGDPAVVALCHCISCQKISGGTNTANVAVKKDQLTVTTGTPKSYSQKHESGMTLTIFFCETCSTILYKHATAEMFAEFSLIQAGTLDGGDKGELSKPGVEMYVKERMPWLSGIHEVAQKQEFV